ncbi:MAG: septum formation initiator family protein [Bacteroidales bacterium]|nr:septum formation initiator family protein [Bacteroidales bacterium]
MTRKEVIELFRPLVTNKYVLAVVIFLVLLLIDQNSLSVRYELSQKVDKMENEKQMLQGRIEQTRRKMDELKSDKSMLEKFAREEYYMKKPDEVIYIIK